LATFHEVLELALLPQVEEAFGEDEPPLADLELHTAAFDLRASVDPQSPSDRPLPYLLDEESCAHERAGALDIDDLAGEDGARRIEESGEIVRCVFAAGILGRDARRKANANGTGKEQNETRMENASEHALRSAACGLPAEARLETLHLRSSDPECWP